jgi:hypothetical protein
MKYQDRPTQEQKLLEMLRLRGSYGVYAWEIIKDLNILQYNARVFGLRRKGYKIVNKKPGLFVLQERGQTTLI